MNVPTHVTLTVMHPSLEPDAISRLLQLEADVKYRVGEPRRSPITGESGRACSYAHWSHIFLSTDGKEITKLAKDVLAGLRERAAGLEHVRATGGSAFLAVPVGSEDQRLHVEQVLASSAPEVPVDVQVELWRHPHADLG